MPADISRDTFAPEGHALRVVQEQGAVLLDADANEQTAILLHRLHTLAADLFGPSWGPRGDSPDGQGPLAGFKIGQWDAAKKDFPITAGRYYAEGVLCENEAACHFRTQPTYPITAAPTATDGTEIDLTRPFVVYLDAWERQVSEAEIRGDRGRVDPALQALSPAPRTQVAWQVKVVSIPPPTSPPPPPGEPPAPPADPSKPYTDADPLAAADALANLLKVSKSDGTLAVRVNPALVGRSGEGGGPENQLYRLEVHRGGVPYQPGSGDAKDSHATFKWSRDNGSVTFPLALADGLTEWTPDQKLHTFTVHLADAGHDARTGLRVHDRVEYIDPAIEFLPVPPTPPPIRHLFEVAKVEGTVVTLKARAAGAIALTPLPAGVVRWAYLRRWESRPGEKAAKDLKHATGLPPGADDGALLAVASVTEGGKKPEWLDLDAGIQVRFEAGKTYRAGDYWLLPARAATGDVIWPQQVPDGKDATAKPGPKAVPPADARHRYAVLAVVDPGRGVGKEVVECRRRPALAALTELIK